MFDYISMSLHYQLHSAAHNATAASGAASPACYFTSKRLSELPAPSPPSPAGTTAQIHLAKNAAAAAAAGAAAAAAAIEVKSAELFAAYLFSCCLLQRSRLNTRCNPSSSSAAAVLSACNTQYDEAIASSYCADVSIWIKWKHLQPIAPQV
jgi:hypothetical protein